MNINNGYVWMEKYRPTSFENIVLDPLNKTILKNIIETSYFPNLLFYGPPGTGKTTTIINLVNSYQEKLNQQDTFINKQKEAMSLYENKISKVNDKISFLKYNYEQANTHANNFSSVELQRYFADSIR
jgi:replication-associated recombination protein RarA